MFARFRILQKRGFRSFSSGKEKVFLVHGRRTPFGKFGESLKEITPVDLAVFSTKAVLEDTKLKPDKIEHVIVGNVSPVTVDTLYAARHIALKSGLPIQTPAYGVNRLCGSGIQAIVDAANMVRRGDANAVIAAGTENMSMSPHLVYGGRFGTRFGPLKTVDMLMDSLTDSYVNCPMAITAENLATQFQISREECDQFGLRSHNLAAKAYKDGHLQGEVVNVPLKKGHLDKDEQVRFDATITDIAKLKASFKKDGVVTPGTASGIVDGAASVLVANETFVKRHNLQPLSEIGESSVVGVEPTIMGIGPSPAIKLLLNKMGKSLKDIDLVEINEAFAAQTLACVKDLGLNIEKLNVWGGAIAIGHPLGASGIRLALTLSRQLHAYNKKHGIVSACIGGGQGIALYLSKP
jgi:acetyl-CoA acyltransferase 2